MYDLSGPMARRSGEAEAGVGRLMADAAPPALLARLKTCVEHFNGQGGLRLYPGSPVLAAAQMRPSDRLIAYELRVEDAKTLVEALGGDVAQVNPARRTAVGADTPQSAAERTQVRVADGYAHAFADDPADAAVACLVDAPFETGLDAERIHAFTRRCLESRPGAVLAVWAPLKDLESYDHLLRGLEAAGGRRPLNIVSAEVRLRSLMDPLRMNGCAMILVNAPLDLGALEDACGWIVRTCGDADGRALIRRL